MRHGNRKSRMTVTRLQSSCFQGRTLEVWRKEALQHKAQMSPRGYPLVEWTKSMWTILTRMRFSIGRHGDCRRYRIIDGESSSGCYGSVV